MFAVLTFGFLVWTAIFLLIVVIGSHLFAAMVEKQAICLRLIIDYAPLPVTTGIPSHPAALSRYVSWTKGKNTDPVGCQNANIGFTISSIGSEIPGTICRGLS